MLTAYLYELNNSYYSIYSYKERNVNDSLQRVNHHDIVVYG